MDSRAETTYFLESSFSALEQSIKSMIKLVQQEQNKQNFYLKRPELLKMVQGFQKSCQSLQQHFHDSSARSSISSLPESGVEHPDSSIDRSRTFYDVGHKLLSFQEMSSLAEEICWHLEELTRRNEEKRQANRKLMEEKSILVEQNNRLMDENKALCDMIQGCKRKSRATNRKNSKLSRLKSFFLVLCKI